MAHACEKFCNDNKLEISWEASPTIESVEVIVEKLSNSLKKNIENNGLNITLYDQSKIPPHPLHERYSQTLFYATADNYCDANNVGLTRESNAGRGPVDFKFNNGYSLNYLVEVKLTSNRDIVHAFEEQLPIYQQAENSSRAALLIIRVTNSATSIKRILTMEQNTRKEGKKVPRIFIIDGRLKPSASKAQTVQW